MRGFTLPVREFTASEGVYTIRGFTLPVKGFIASEGVYTANEGILMQV